MGSNYVIVALLEFRGTFSFISVSVHFVLAKESKSFALRMHGHDGGGARSFIVYFH